jgi:hypothetical protein
MSKVSRGHRVGAFAAKLEHPMDGSAFILMGAYAYRDASLLLGAFALVFLVISYLRYTYPRPPENNDMVMWGVYRESSRFMAAAFLSRRDAERWSIATSREHEGRFAVCSRYGGEPVMVAENGEVVRGRLSPSPRECD